MTGCSAKGCKNRSDIGISFHRFPKNEILRQKWIDAINRENWEPNQNSRLCSRHFRDEDFNKTYTSGIRLKEDAIPSIFFYCKRPNEWQNESMEPSPKRARITCISENQLSSIEFSKSQQLEAVKLDNPTTSLTKNNKEDFVEPLLKTGKISRDKLRNKNLRRQLGRAKSRIAIYKRKIRKMQQKNKRLTKKVANIDIILQDLRKKANFSDEMCSLLTSLGQTTECLIKRSIGKVTNPHQRKTFDAHLRAFAITLHFLSPKAYSFVRKHFNTALPHPRTLGRWYSSVQGDPGFSEEVMLALKQYAQKNTRPQICSLIVDCMSIKKHLEWDGKKFCGTVNVGSSVEDDSATLASEALVFYLVFVNSAMKIPLGHFFVNGVSGEQLCGLVKQCLTLVHDTGVTVCSLTCDGTSANVSMANHLGCELTHDKLKSYFPHPITEKPIYLFLDPSHMLKLVRNTLGDYKVLKDGNEKNVEWKYIEMLHEFQDKEGLRLGNKLTKMHIRYEKQKMKVKLAAQLFSDSVADSLRYLKLSNHPDFLDCEATISFLKVFNDLFDVLNSRSIVAKGNKKALCKGNFSHHSTVLLKAKQYILNLTDNEGNSLLKSRRKTGFLGFLVCIESALLMFKNYVEAEKGETPYLKYLPLYKVSQDHLERLFGYIRSRGGANNNPTARQFTSTFKRLLLHTEIHEGNSGNSTVLDSSIFLRIHGAETPSTTLNHCTPQWRLLTEEEKSAITQAREEDNFGIHHISNDTLTSDLACDIVQYIAGFVTKTLKSKLICEGCITELSEHKNSSVSLLNCKDRGGLIQPSKSVQEICKISECVIRKRIKSKSHIPEGRVIEEMTISVLKSCVGKHLFQSPHFLEQEPDQSHLCLLIKAICVAYFNVRLNHHAKLFNEHFHSQKIRNSLCKTVLFLGQ